MLRVGAVERKVLFCSAMFLFAPRGFLLSYCGGLKFLLRERERERERERRQRKREERERRQNEVGNDFQTAHCTVMSPVCTPRRLSFDYFEIFS